MASHRLLTDCLRCSGSRLGHEPDALSAARLRRRLAALDLLLQETQDLARDGVHLSTVPDPRHRGAHGELLEVRERKAARRSRNVVDRAAREPHLRLDAVAPTREVDRTLF